MDLMPFDPMNSLAVTAELRRAGRGLEFIYELGGDPSDVVIPPLHHPGRTDGLWQATCFEAFISIGESSYVELNFAPSGQWAAYRFTSYRQDMNNLEIAPPEISFAQNRLVARVDLAAKAGSAFNLTAVIEHKAGLRSYWALAHPKSNRPDFHTRDCFVARLP